jgi:hypothetical protein
VGRRLKAQRQASAKAVQTKKATKEKIDTEEMIINGKWMSE